MLNLFQHITGHCNIYGDIKNIIKYSFYLPLIFGYTRIANKNNKRKKVDNMMPFFLKIVRLIALLVVNVLFIIPGVLLKIVFFIGDDKKTDLQAELVRCWARCLCMILGIHIKITGSITVKKGLFVVSNHCSYLDIPVIASVLPVAFLSKKEVASWILFGWLARLGGTVFVDRKLKVSTVVTIKEVTEKLHKGANVVVFPEGTTDDGLHIIEFKSSFFEVPADNRLPVLPLSILYSHIDNMPLDNNSRFKIIWYGNEPFLSHFWGLLGFKRIDVRLHINPLITEEVMRGFNGHMMRKSLSGLAYESVSKGCEDLKREITGAG